MGNEITFAVKPQHESSSTGVVLTTIFTLSSVAIVSLLIAIAATPILPPRILASEMVCSPFTMTIPKKTLSFKVLLSISQHPLFGPGTKSEPTPIPISLPCSRLFLITDPSGGLSAAIPNA